MDGADGHPEIVGMAERAFAVTQFESISGKDKFLFGSLHVVHASVVVEDVDMNRALDLHRLPLIVIEEDAAAEAAFGLFA